MKTKQLSIIIGLILIITTITSNGEHYQWGGYTVLNVSVIMDLTIVPSCKYYWFCKSDVDELITEAYDLSDLNTGSAYLNPFYQVLLVQQ
ncbi:MAG: hypothetical protein IPF62_11005 [Bacteroidetes bacterium]|nr:hypothetical protein [Bacteroidota bacterium]